jgi:hypothetical protein
MTNNDFWLFWPLVPIYPYSQRQTIRREIVPDTIWTFEQLQGIFYVVVPIRMTVIKLRFGGLLVYAPVAPTRECIRLLDELVEKHGEVKYIILPTISGLEHKVFVGPFARKFPKAKVYVAPHQWSFPVKLPLSWLGFPARRTHVLPADSSQVPFGDEFDYAILERIDLRLGQFSEVAFWHKRSHTLLVTDSIVSIPEDPPEVLQLDLNPLLFHAKDSALEDLENTYPNRRKGWQRICLFAMYFQSSVLKIPRLSEVLINALKAPNKSKQAYFGLFPFQWSENWQEAFYSLRGNDGLIVAPILQTLILNRAPQETLEWVEKVSRWQFDRLIACHFDSPVNTSPQEFRQAFAFLEFDVNSFPEADVQALKTIDRFLYKSGLVPPPKSNS